MKSKFFLKIVLRTFCRLLVWVLIWDYSLGVAWAQGVNVEGQIGRQDLKSMDQRRILEKVPSFRDKPTGFQYIESDQSIQQNAMGQMEQKIKVHVLGEVYKPGVFNVTVSDRLVDVLKQAYPKRNSIRRVELRHPDEKTESYDLYQYYYYGNLKQNPFLRDNDVIFVPILPGAVRIEGPVGRPGVYELSGEKSLSALVNLSGGFTSSVLKSQPVKVIRIGSEGEKVALEIPMDTKAMNSFRIQKGDIFVIPDVLNKGISFDYSIESFPAENAFYPTSKPDVYVVGAVNAPGAYPFKPYLTAKEYLAFAGAGDNARLRKVTLVRGNKRKYVKLDTKLNPGDLVIVKTKTINNLTFALGILSAAVSLTLATLSLKNELR